MSWAKSVINSETTVSSPQTYSNIRFRSGSWCSCRSYVHNEGVKRIYTDMKSYFLEPPIFSEANKKTVLLVLKNNIASRSLRKMEGVKSIGVEEWAKLKPLDTMTMRMKFGIVLHAYLSLPRHINLRVRENQFPDYTVN